MGDAMISPEQRDELRERNQRRANNCPYCGSPAIHELTTEEKHRRSDVFEVLRYRGCGACGQTWRMRRG